MDERRRFVEAAYRSEIPMTELCELFGISRKTGYKWLDRFDAKGREGLLDRSRAPKNRPWVTDPQLEKELVRFRKAHPRWGARKVRHVLATRWPEKDWPAPSTITDIFHRHGLVVSRRRRRHWNAGNASPLADVQPNDTWCADFKGHFRTGDGTRIHPFTLSDAHSRFLIAVQDVRAETSQAVKGVMERAFRDYGLPGRVRSDNGSPFGSRGLYGLTRLAAWLIKLGIHPDRIEPASPQQNGRHERMHKTLKDETARPPANTRAGQQRRFDRFRSSFNEERPHEALGMQTPAQVYDVSGRPWPARVEDPSYPAHFETRRVRTAGEIKWRGQHVFISEPLAGETVGIEPIDDGWWVLNFGHCKLALLDDTGKDTRVVPLPYRGAPDNLASTGMNSLRSRPSGVPVESKPSGNDPQTAGPNASEQG